MPFVAAEVLEELEVTVVQLTALPSDSWPLRCLESATAPFVAFEEEEVSFVGLPSLSAIHL